MYILISYLNFVIITPSYKINDCEKLAPQTNRREAN